MQSQVDIPTLRRELDAAFDDEELTRLCREHFPEVYRAFGGGLDESTWEGDPTREQQTRLRETVIERFNDEELRTLCEELGVDYDSLPAQGKAGKARELVAHLRRRGRLPELVEALRRSVGKAERIQRLIAHCREEDCIERLAAYAGRKEEAVEGARGTKPDRSDERAAPPGPVHARWALLVGINRYVDPAIPALKFCVNDVLALERSLQGLGYTVVTLHDEAQEERLRPTRDNVEAELARMCRSVGPDDLLWVHFAGHGKLLDGRALLLTRETRLPTMERRALPLTEVEREMRDSPARRLILTLDACHSGVEIGRDLADPEFIRNAYELAEGFALIAASTAQQIALEWAEKEHGVFTYYLLEGLQGTADRAGKGFVTVSDLQTHVLGQLRHWNVTHGMLQEPTARTEGLGDIILADHREAAQPTSQPKSSQPLL
jgi:hypothetical protein